VKTLESLNALLLENLKLLGINRQSFDLWIDQGTIEIGSGKETEKGLHFCDYQYRLALSIEAMHAHRGGLLLAMLHNWECSLDECTRRDLSAPQVITSSTTKQSGGGKVLQVEYTLDVRDGIYLTRSSNGPVVANGERWTFGNHELGIAEAIGMTTGAR